MHGWLTYGDDVLCSKLIYAKETEDYENDVKEICQDGGPHEPQEVKHLAFDDGKLKNWKTNFIIRVANIIYASYLIRKKKHLLIINFII